MVATTADEHSHESDRADQERRVDSVDQAGLVDLVARPTFDELYAGSYAPMVRLAAVLVDTMDDAEHVVQDAFVAMYRRYDSIRNPGGYLRTSVVNGSRKVLRRRRLLRRRPPTDPDHDELGFNHVIDQVRALPHDQRVVIALRYDQQMTDSEIATELDLPIGTVKSRLHRAIAKLRDEQRREEST